MKEGEQRLIRAAGSMGLMTALSRIAGYVRDLMQARILGAGLPSDAFVIAYRIPNLLRRLMAEGALTAAFVPTFARYMKSGDEDRLWRFAASVLWALTAILVLIVVLGVLLSPLLVRALAWGYGAEPGKIDLTVRLNQLLWPYIFLISLAALASAILNAFGSFALPAFTPVLLNVTIIGCAVFLGRFLPNPAYAFAAGVLLGGCLQLGVQVPAVLRLGFRWRRPAPLDAAGVREVGRLMLPRVFGVGITQINLVVDSQFATSLRSGSASFLYYANRITELALGIFGISLSTVLLPVLSRAAADGDRRRVLETLATAVRLLMFVTVPATLGLIILRVPIVHVLFEHERFTSADTALTAGALACYSVGLLPYAAVNVLAAAFYAHRDTRTPVRVGVFTFFLHLGLNFTLRRPLQHAGIALSTALSACADSALLAWLLRRRYGEFVDAGVRSCARRSAVSAAVMGGALLLALRWVDVPAIPSLVSKVAALGLLIGGGGAVYLAMAWTLGSEEMKLLRSVMSRGGTAT